MDVIAHTLWTNAVFHFKYKNQRRMRYLAAFFGVAPDLVGFTPLFIYLIISGRVFNGERLSFLYQTHWTFRFAEEAYNYTHSLVIFGICFLSVLILGNLYKHLKRGSLQSFSWRKAWFFWPMLGWALHILIDIPTHPDFYSTPFLYPISSFENHHGMPWSHPVFMVVNYTLLAMAYAAISVYHRRRRAKILSKSLNKDGKKNHSTNK